MLADTHCHLDSRRFDPDREAVIRRAEDAGVGRILVPGLTVDSSLAAVALAERYPTLYAAVGLHPTEARRATAQSWAVLRELASHPKVVAIGETGLDYYWNAAPVEAQKEALQAQLELALEFGLPVILHLREAQDKLSGDCAKDLLEIVAEWRQRMDQAKPDSHQHPLAERPGVFHSFSASAALAQEVIQLGFFIGVSGSVTFENARRRQSIVASLPLEKLLLETDAPYLAPHPYRGQRNEPAYLHLIADKIAWLHQRAADEVAAITSRNARRLFSWE